MRNVRPVFMLCAVFGFGGLVGACSTPAPPPSADSATTTGTDTLQFADAPPVTDVPVAPDVPVATDSGVGADVPMGIDSPMTADAPVTMDVPVTDAPALVDVPIASDVPPADSGLVDAGPTCGGGSMRMCSGFCTDLMNDPGNCGACGRSCPSVLVCSGGACVCPSGGTRCPGDTCVNTASDPGNCGTCGHACGSGQMCAGGVCVCATTGFTACPMGCVNMNTDSANCGGCGHGCASELSCLGGVCVCPGGATHCGTSCVNVASDNANCGVCFHACSAGQVCSSGVCTCSASGLTACGASCVNPLSDNANCGGCGRACTGGQICTSGVCTAVCTLTMCGSVCTTTASDPQNCASCGHVCPTASNGTSTCTSGVCGLSCNTGFSQCGTACANLQTDPPNCGHCGNACAVPDHGTATCVAGVCGTGACLPGYHACGTGSATTCNDNTSVATCGTACMPCPSTVANASPACVSQSCWYVCNSGYVDTGSACIPIQPPQQVAPLSTSTVTSLRPTLTWTLPSARITGARLELCADRDCTLHLGAAVDVAGTSYSPSADLPTSRTIYWRLFGRAGTSVGTTASPVWQLRTGARSASNRTAWGTSLHDANGDGYGDAVVGSVDRLSVYLGSSTGFAGPASTPASVLSDPGGSGNAFGNGSAWGDVDGEGHAELSVGSVTYGSGSVGRAYLYSGVSGTSGVAAVPAAIIEAPSDSPGRFGFVTALCDIYGDGHASLIVDAQSVPGAVYVYRGTDTGLVTTSPTHITVSGSSALDSVACLGDVDGDGFADVGVSDANWHRPSDLSPPYGRFHVFRGSRTGLSALPDWTVSAPAGVGAFGTVATAGDVNGDGYGDIAVVGTPGTAGSIFHVYVYMGSSHGPASLPSVDLSMGSVAAGYFGVDAQRIAAADFNGDGIGDLVIGQTESGDITGHAFVFPGRVSVGPANVAMPAIAGPDGGHFGLLSAADVNGDGFADLLVGAAQANRAYVYVGASGGLSAPATTLLMGMNYFGNPLAMRDLDDGSRFPLRIVPAPLATPSRDPFWLDAFSDGAPHCTTSTRLPARNTQLVGS